MSEKEVSIVTGCPQCNEGSLIYQKSQFLGFDSNNKVMWGWGWVLYLEDTSIPLPLFLDVNYCPKCGTKLPDLEAEYVASR